ncbi:hypothetical protein LZT47_09285 [Enterococcus avium]|uniref:hypothetical protein n=1 Tax=Enterococcus avium TaxID=33945 RepID=UPI002379BCAB|nr:hypothetical protein [Enterococcus avium]MDD9142046.1 hypothetical protein [Enterococcus avium]
MNLVTLPQELSVYQVADLKEIDFTQQPLFISVTEEEISVVSATANVPTNTINREDSWKAFKIEGADCRQKTSRTRNLSLRRLFI